jgi:hypothetical protein
MVRYRRINTGDVVALADLLARGFNRGYWSRAFRRLRDNATPPEPTIVATSAVRCREIMAFDLETVINLLTLGFDRDRDRGYWLNAIRKLTDHPTPPGLPKYGYLLEVDGVTVGVLLLIFSSRLVDGSTIIYCNCSSFYVAPSFRSYAPLLIRRATRFKNDITYLNVTPARHTWPMLEVLGYSRFSNGLFITIPTFCRSLPNLQIRFATADTCRDGRLPPFEIDLLLAHANYGCMSLICGFEGAIYPFVFGLRRKYGLPLAHLIYCRDQEDFIWLAGSLGRFLRKCGYLLVVLDANRPIRGLIGGYMPIRPKYWIGARPPRLGDLPYTERVMFGF